MRTLEYTSISATTSELANLPMRLNKMNEEGWEIEGHLGTVGGLDGVKTNIFLLSRPIPAEETIKTEPVAHASTYDEACARGYDITYPHEYCEWETKKVEGQYAWDVVCSSQNLEIIVPSVRNEIMAEAMVYDHNVQLDRKMAR